MATDRIYSMSPTKESFIQHLEQDPMRNLVILKLIKQFGDDAHLVGTLSDHGSAILLTIETRLSHYLSELYPETNQGVFISTDQPELLPPYLDTLKEQTPLLLAIKQDDGVKTEAGKVFTLEHKRTNLSLTISNLEMDQSSGELVVQMREGIDQRVRPFFFENGYSDPELDQLESWGGKTFAYEASGALASACFIYPNYQNIWEVAGVRTAEEFRGKGYAKEVVKQALHYILERGYTPRYQFESTNTASLRLAESIGMKTFLKLDHYIARKK
jgi:RimJ/RimL family protein N-acetyltransferase